MKKSKWVGLVTLGLSILIGISAFNNVDAQAATKTIKIATTGVSYPGSYKNPKGELDGYDVAVAKAAAKKLGYKIKWTTTSFDGLLGQLSSGKVDTVASNMTITSERKQTYAFSDPYGYFKIGVAVNKDSKLKSVKDLGSKNTIAATVGSNQINQLKVFNSKIKIRTFDDREQAINAVLNKQTDGYANSKTILQSSIKDNNLSLKILKGSIGESDIAFTFNKNAAGRKYQKQFNKAVKELKKDGTLSKLSKKYFNGIDASKD